MWRVVFGRFGLLNLFIGFQAVLYLGLGALELVDGQLKTGIAAVVMAAFFLWILFGRDPTQPRERPQRPTERPANPEKR